jgi:D-alanine-D-alanine ligase
MGKDALREGTGIGIFIHPTCLEAPLISVLWGPLPNQTMERPLIAVVRGGYSGESVISHQSAARMMAAIDSRAFDALFVTIAHDAWTCEDVNGTEVPFDRALFRGGRELRQFAAALIAIHGSPGEDGLLQGYLDMLGIPYQTGGVLNMALTFSKFNTSAILRRSGFAVAPSVLLYRSTPKAVEQAAALGFPCFVKPDRSGSSLGVSKVKSAQDLPAALEAAFNECPAVMVESAVKGRELTCGVIRLEGAIQALPVCEIRTSREFFDYEAKYHAADTEELIPAPLPSDVTTLVQERSAAIYHDLDCRGMVRVDHFWTGTDLVTIELNTVPGFSSASIFPKMLDAANIPVEHAVNSLIAECVTRSTPWVSPPNGRLTE